MTRDAPEHAVDVTIALLTRNAGPLLDRVLSSIFRQKTTKRFEVLAVDSGSTDDTLDILRRFSARIMSIPPEDFNFGRTRDLAFEHAHGAIVVSLSQDAIPAHDRWLDNLLRPLEDPTVAASCGRSIPDPERDIRQFPWERNGFFYFTREMKKFSAQYGKGLSNANSAIRREVWQRLRFGEQAIGEDFRFQTKLARENLRVVFPDDAPVLHHHHYSLRTLTKRCRNEGLGLRQLGCRYTEFDLIADLLSPRKYLLWLREVASGNLKAPAALLFPLLRPIAVYVGSRFGRRYRP